MRAFKSWSALCSLSQVNFKAIIEPKKFFFNLVTPQVNDPSLLCSPATHSCDVGCVRQKPTFFSDIDSKEVRFNNLCTGLK